MHFLMLLLQLAFFFLFVLKLKIFLNIVNSFVRKKVYLLYLLTLFPQIVYRSSLLLIRRGLDCLEFRSFVFSFYRFCQ